MRKKWTNNDIGLLLTLNKEKIPLKILSWVFNVTINSVSKTLGRYNGNNSWEISLPIPIVEQKFYKELLELLNRVMDVKSFFQSNKSLTYKTIKINKILHPYGWPPVGSQEILTLMEEKYFIKKFVMKY